MTSEFVETARQAEPVLLVTEGTRVNPRDSRRNMSERAVLKEAVALTGSTENLVLSTFKGNDVDRINTFAEACSRTGRRLVVSMKAAMVLKKLEADGGIRVPRVGKEASVYVKRKRSGKLDDRDYRPWERQFLNDGVSAAEVGRRQSEIFLHLDVWNFPELIDIRPARGGAYIHAATEAFNEEGEQEEEVIRNWTEHLGFAYHQLHASGHAPGYEVGKLVQRIEAKVVVPVHTEYPRMFESFRKGRDWGLEIPEKGRPIRIGGS